MITLTINGDTAEEVAICVKSFAAVLSGDLPVIPPSSQTQTLTADAHKLVADAASVPALVAPTAAVTPTPAPITPAVPLAAPATYTHEQLMRAAAPLVDAGKLDELRALLTPYNVPGIPQLPPDALSSFATSLRALGAQI